MVRYNRSKDYEASDFIIWNLGFMFFFGLVVFLVGRELLDWPFVIERESLQFFFTLLMLYAGISWARFLRYWQFLITWSICWITEDPQKVSNGKLVALKLLPWIPLPLVWFTTASFEVKLVAVWVSGFVLSMFTRAFFGRFQLIRIALKRYP